MFRKHWLWFLAVAVIVASPRFVSGQTNLLTNPGFESGQTGWGVGSGSFGTRSTDPSPHSGSNYYFAGTATNAWIYQMVDLAALGYDTDRLNTGGYYTQYNGWQCSNTYTDEGRISLVQYNSSGSVMSNTDLGTHTTGASWVAYSSGSERVLAGTTKLRYTFEATKRQGSNNDAYLDDASLYLYESTIWTYGNNNVDYWGSGNRNVTSGDLRFGNTASGGARITDGSTFTSSVPIYLGYASSVAGDLKVSGATLNSTSDLYVGNSGSGNLSISNGAHVTDSFGIAGFNSGSSGTVTVSGSGSNWSNTGNLLVGLYGSGNLSISDGAQVTNSQGFVGYGGSSGTVTVSGSGSKWSNTDALTVGLYGSGNLSISDGAQVTNTYGYAGLYSGSSGTVTVTGSGSAWNNSNLYLGGSSNGPGGTGSLTVASGGQVSVTGTMKVWNTGTVNLNGGTISTQTFDNSAGGTVNFTDGNLSVNGGRFKWGSSSLTINGSGSSAQPTLTLNAVSPTTFSGDINVGDTNKGSLTISGGAQVTSANGYAGYNGGAAGTVTVTGSGSAWNNSNLYLGGNSLSAGGTGSLTVASGGQVNVTGTTIIWNSNSKLVVNGATMTTGNLQGSAGSIRITDPAGGVALTVGSAANGSFSGTITDDTAPGSIAKVGSGTLTLAGNNTYTGRTQINGGTLQTDTAGINGGDTTNGIYFGGTFSTLKANTSTGITTGKAVSIASGMAFFDTSNGNITLNGTVSGNSNTSLVKEGGRTLTLAGHNSYTGPTYIDGGTLQADTQGINGSDTTNRIQFLHSATLKANAAGITTGKAVSLGNYVWATFDTSNGAIMLTGTLSGDSTTSLVKTGGNQLWLGAKNAFTGATYINGGTLHAGPMSINWDDTTNGIYFGGVDGTLMAGADITTGKAVMFTNPSGSAIFDTSYGDITLNGRVSGNSSTALVAAGGGTLTLAGNNSYTGTTYINGGTLQTDTAGINGGNTTNGIYFGLMPATLKANTSTGITTGKGVALGTAGSATFDTSNGSIALSGTVSGNSNTTLIKAGAGVLTLAAKNTYTGWTQINGGTLQADTDGINGGDTTGSIYFGGTGATLKARTSFGITTGKPVTLSNSGSATFDTSNGDITLSGTVSGNSGASVVKTGGGTLTLAGNNSYNGPTVVHAGTLALGASSSIANSPTIVVGDTGSSGASLDVTAKTGGFTIGSGQTLKGIGTINAAGTSVINNGILATGNSIGTLNVTGDYTFGSTSTWQVETDATTSDKIVIGGTATIQSGAAISFSGSTGAGKYVLATAASGLDSGAFTGTVPTDYTLKYLSTHLDLQHKATIGIVNVQSGLRVLVGSSAFFMFGVSNTAPADSDNLVFSVAAGSGTTGGFSGMPPEIPGQTMSMGVTFTNSGASGTGKTGTFIVSDPNASNSPQTGTVTAAVYEPIAVHAGDGSVINQSATVLRADAKVLAAGAVSNPDFAVSGLATGTVIHPGNSAGSVTMTTTANRLNGKHTTWLDVGIGYDSNQGIYGAPSGVQQTVSTPVSQTVAGNTVGPANLHTPQTATILGGKSSPYAGFSSTVEHGVSDATTGETTLGTTATILRSDYNNGPDTILSMTWRARTAAEVGSGSVSPVLSDIVSISGTGSDKFVLQMTYDDTKFALGQEAQWASQHKIGLAYLDPDNNWTNAVMGNSGANDPSFQGVVAWTNDITLGHWGVDTSHNVVWAVINYGGLFSVVPEPGTLAMLVCGLAALAIWFRRRLW